MQVTSLPRSIVAERLADVGTQARACAASAEAFGRPGHERSVALCLDTADLLSATARVLGRGSEDGRRPVLRRPAEAALVAAEEAAAECRLQEDAAETFACCAASCGGVVSLLRRYLGTLTEDHRLDRSGAT